MWYLDPCQNITLALQETIIQMQLSLIVSCKVSRLPIMSFTDRFFFCDIWVIVKLETQRVTGVSLQVRAGDGSLPGLGGVRSGPAWWHPALLLLQEVSAP